MLKKSFFLVVFFGCVNFLSAQSPCSNIAMPVGAICITQADANTAASNAREVVALRDGNLILKDQVAAEKQINLDNKATADANRADLTAALHKTEVELATKTGQLIGCEANSVRQLAVIDVLLKNIRPKKIGLINF